MSHFIREIKGTPGKTEIALRSNSYCQEVIEKVTKYINLKFLHSYLDEYNCVVLVFKNKKVKKKESLDTFF